MFDDACEQLTARRGEAESAANRAALMGTEGAATRAYFQTWVQALPLVWEFTGRKRRPPPDPVNAMLSFGYTLLTNEAVAAREAAHLDLDVGFLHLPRVGRPSLALDMVEEFRPVLVDSLVLGIVGRGMLTREDFVYQPDTGSRMRDRAKRVLLTAGRAARAGPAVGRCPADRARRGDVALLLSGHGPRVQLSVFEVELAERSTYVTLRGKLRELSDTPGVWLLVVLVSVFSDDPEVSAFLVGSSAEDIDAGPLTVDRVDTYLVFDAVNDRSQP